MTHLADQVAVVTGAGGGIGKAIALALGTQGATLALVGRRLARWKRGRPSLAVRPVWRPAPAPPILPARNRSTVFHVASEVAGARGLELVIPCTAAHDSDGHRRRRTAVASGVEDLDLQLQADPEATDAVPAVSPYAACHGPRLDTAHVPRP